MKLEPINNAANFKLDNKSKLEIPFYLTFTSKNHASLRNFKVQFQEENNIKISSQQIRVNDGEPSKPPITIDNKTNNVNELTIILETKNDLPDNKLIECNVSFQFDFNQDSLSESVYKIKFKINDGSVDLQEFKKVKPVKQYSGFILFCLWLLIIYIWNLFNNNIFDSIWFLSSSIVFSALLFITLFFGIKTEAEIKNFFRWKKIKQFFNNIEFYIEPSTLKFFGYKITILVSIIIVLLFFILAYKFWPIELPKNEFISYYYKDNQINEKNIYRHKINTVSVGLNNKYLNDSAEIIPIANLSAGILTWGSAGIVYDTFKYYKNETFADLDTNAETIDIENLIQKQNSPEDKMIFDRLKGDTGLIKYNGKEKHFYYVKHARRGDSAIEHPEYANTNDLIIDVFKNNIVSKIYMNLNFSDLDTEYIPTTNKYLEHYFSDHFPREEDISNFYDIILNETLSGGSKPFFDGELFETFIRLLKLDALFHGAEKYIENINYQEIGKDFQKYINHPKGTSKRKGLNGLSRKIIALYTHFLCHVQNIRQSNEYLNDIYQEIVNSSKNLDSTLTGVEQSNEKTSRITFIRYLFVESARFNISLDQNPKMRKLFTEEKESLTDDPDMNNKLSYLPGETDYNRFLEGLKTSR